MKTIKDVHGSEAMAIPVYVGKTRVDVHTNIRKVTDPDPITGEMPENMYVYDETQMTHQEYSEWLGEQNAKLDASLVNAELALVELYEKVGA